jgi:acyl carrier protein
VSDNSPQGNRHQRRACDRGDEAAAAGEPVVAYIQQLWREMLRVDDVNQEATFYELGGDSLLMVHMLVAVTGKFACEIDYEEFLGAPSMANLVQLVNAARASDPGIRSAG